MRQTVSLIILIFCISFSGFSQDLLWKANFNSFFDNIEFGQSEFKVPQTMAGVQVSPEIGLKWDSLNIIAGGVNLVHDFGSRDPIDKIYLTAYYELNKGSNRFLMGAFPRNGAIDKYPRIFFQDSVSYYRPNINGIFWQAVKGSSYFNLWLDWTGRMSVTEREAFFVGLSGRYNYGIFYLQHFGYMFHFAKDLDPVVKKGIYDNGLFLTSAGIDISGRSFLEVADISAGFLTGIERDRSGENKWRFNNGLNIETRLESKFAGILNTLYLGEGQMSFYNNHNNNLYWGDPVYRAGNYNRTDFYFKFLHEKRVDLRLTYSLHLAEGRLYHEQMLKASVNLSNLK